MATPLTDTFSAKPVEPGKYDLIIHPSNLWLTIHESVEGCLLARSRDFSTSALQAGMNR